MLGSGGAVHNLGRLAWGGEAEPPAWAVEFERWLRERLAARAHDDVIRFAERAPAARLAHPTHDHIAPLLVALGADSGAASVTFPIEGFEYDSLSRLAVRFDDHRKTPAMPSDDATARSWWLPTLGILCANRPAPRSQQAARGERTLRARSVARSADCRRRGVLLCGATSIAGPKDWQ